MCQSVPHQPIWQCPYQPHKKIPVDQPGMRFRHIPLIDMHQHLSAVNFEDSLVNGSFVPKEKT